MLCFIHHSRALLMAAAANVLVSGCTVADDPLTIGNNQGDLTWEEFLDVAYQEPDTGIYIVNGDEAIESEQMLQEFYYQIVSNGELSVYNINGQDVRWGPLQALNLTYCVSSSSFGSRYSTVVSAMSAAASAWESVANVNFIHYASQDSNCTASNSNVMFDVRQTSIMTYLARAFFPNYSRSARNILISTSAFGNISPWTMTGVLRHELGHALGFRHEHTRPEAGTCFEDNNWRALTPYDSSSVMHYPQCNGTQTGDLVITSRDAQGAAALYPPTVFDECNAGAACTSNSQCGYSGYCYNRVCQCL